MTTILRPNFEDPLNTAQDLVDNNITMFGKPYTGHSISVNEDHPAQGLAVDPLYFRISILPRWQIPDQHESRTRPLRFTQNLTHVFLWICALICIFFIESCSYWNKIWRNESILTKIGLFYLFGINFSSWILKNNAQLKQKCSLHSHFFLEI